MTIFESVKNNRKSIYLRIPYILVAFLFTLLTIVPAYATQNFTINTSPACSSPSVVMDGDFWCGNDTVTRMDTTGALVASYDIRALTSEPTLQVRGITAGQDNNIWFSGYVGSNVKSGQLNISTNTATLYNIGTLDNSPNVSAPITASDGSIWFYARARGGTVTYKMIRVDPSTGVAAVKHTSDSYSYYSQIIKGPDGNPWVEDGYYKRLTSHNATTGGMAGTYPLPSGVTYTTGLSSGPNGSVWLIANNSIYKLTTSDTRFTQYPTTSNVLPSRIVMGTDGAVWFSDVASTTKKIKRITMNGIVTEYSVPSSITQINRLFLGPDNALWFTGNGSSLGRLDVTPDLTSQPADYTPQIITDSNLWAHTASSVIRMNTSGATVANYDIRALAGQSSLTISGITLDSDGNVWFTGVSGNSARAGRIDITTGAISIHYGPLAAYNAQQNVSKPVADAHGGIWYHAQTPYGFSNIKYQLVHIDSAHGTSTTRLTSDIQSVFAGITVANDDRVWIADTYYKRFVAKNPTSETYYAFPAGVNDAENLIAGIDGNIWFTANGSAFRATPDGTFSEYPLTSGSIPRHLTVDIEGALWFVDNGPTKKIGRLSLDGTVIDYAVPSGVTQLESLVVKPEGTLRFGASVSSGSIIGRFGY